MENSLYLEIAIANYLKRLIPYRNKKKWGFCTPDRKIAIDCNYQQVFDFHDEIAMVKLKDWEWAYINENGILLFDCADFDYTDNFSEGFATYSKDGKFGFIDKSGRIAILDRFEHASSFCNGLAKVKSSGKFGFIDKTGELKIPCVYDEIGYNSFERPSIPWWSFKLTEPEFSDGLVRVKKNEKYGFINEKGEDIIPCIFDQAYPFSEGYSCVKSNNRWGYINKNGVAIIPFEFERANSFSEGLASVEKNNNWGIIDKLGKLSLLEKGINNVTSFKEGLCYYSKNGKYGFINRDVLKIIDPIYDCSLFSESWAYFSEGLAKVSVNSKFGYIDKEGKRIIPVVYDEAAAFEEGLARVCTDGKWGYIDKEAELRIPCVYDKVGLFSKGIAKVRYWDETNYINVLGVQYWED